MDQDEIKRLLAEIIGDRQAANVAAALGVDAANLTRWRSPKYPSVPGVERLNAILDACDVPRDSDLGRALWAAYGAPVATTDAA